MNNGIPPSLNNNKEKDKIINGTTRYNYQTRAEQRQVEIATHQQQSIARIQQLDEHFLQHSHGTEVSEDSTKAL